MRTPSFIYVLAITALARTLVAGEGPVATGHWQGWLDSPGGRLLFGLQLERHGENLRSWLINGAERFEVAQTEWIEDRIEFRIEEYDAVLTARPSADGRQLDGEWKKRRGPDAWAKLPFHAQYPAPPKVIDPPVSPDPFAGRWAVTFAADSEPAIAVFVREHAQDLSGTFLTPTGDYRYLAGASDGSGLTLSCFDGAHAFLFKARRLPDGTLDGDFWSGERWHDTWIARRDEQAQLPDAFGLTKSSPHVDWTQCRFQNLDGAPITLADPAAGGGSARIIEVFGTWCPNCHDATTYLVELHHRFRDQGLTVVGLAFEVTGDAARDAAQVKRYRRRMGIDYPVLLAGTSDKTKAAAVLPMLESLRAYPTFLFVDRAGRIQAVYTGFSGPATGSEHQRLRAQFEDLVADLLADRGDR